VPRRRYATHAHGPRLQTGEQEAMEMLATASLLMRALDRADARLSGGQQ
jgi:ABC-type phosphate/phosphonate transport system ATPase subunit